MYRRPRSSINVSALLLRAHQSTDCLVPDGPLGRDGRVIVPYSGLRISLHRLLWVTDGRPLEPREFLKKTCGTFGCVHPDHHGVSTTPRYFKTCPRAHPYTDLDRLPSGRYRCHVCYANKLQRQRRGGEPNWMREKRKVFCPQGHEYTPENIYWEVTPSGRRKRHCKTCVRARRAGKDPAAVAA